VSVLIADDHEVVRRGLRALIDEQSGWQVVAEAIDGREAVAKAEEFKPDVAILDITMPSLNGLEATRQIAKLSPRTKVLILSIHESDQLIHGLLDAGARGYILKADAGRDFSEEGFSQITGREREVVQLLAQGKSSKEIAKGLGIAFKTVETHRANLMRKLNCHSVAEIVRYAVRNHIVDA
jgi:DNA-binding NarL/FixJ family response regulator